MKRPVDPPVLAGVLSWILRRNLANRIEIVGSFRHRMTKFDRVVKCDDASTCHVFETVDAPEAAAATADADWVVVPDGVAEQHRGSTSLRGT